MLCDEQEGWTYRGIGDDDLYKILETYIQHCYASRHSRKRDTVKLTVTVAVNAAMRRKQQFLYIGF